jgi:hypothetical protein
VYFELGISKKSAAEDDFTAKWWLFKKIRCNGESERCCYTLLVTVQHDYFLTAFKKKFSMGDNREKRPLTAFGA